MILQRINNFKLLQLKYFFIFLIFYFHKVISLKKLKSSSSLIFFHYPFNYFHIKPEQNPKKDTDELQRPSTAYIDSEPSKAPVIIIIWQVQEGPLSMNLRWLSAVSHGPRLHCNYGPSRTVLAAPVLPTGIIVIIKVIIIIGIDRLNHRQ